MNVETETAWGRAIPRKVIYKWEFRCSAYIQLHFSNMPQTVIILCTLPWDENGYGDDSRIRQLMPIIIVKYAVKLFLDYLSRFVNSWPSYLRIPDPGSKRFRIPDPSSWSASKNLSIFNPKIVSSSRKYDLGDVHLGSRIRTLIFSHPGCRIQG